MRAVIMSPLAIRGAFLISSGVPVRLHRNVPQAPKPAFHRAEEDRAGVEIVYINMVTLSLVAVDQKHYYVVSDTIV